MRSANYDRAAAIVDRASVLDRAHRTHLDAGESRRAARCAFWIGLRLHRSVMCTVLIPSS
jgi:hypothetical protein